ncbi:hypothetical protein Hdeb2414_s0023g00625211 [Helianthus debilis subsp. tardiflorus]
MLALELIVMITETRLFLIVLEKLRDGLLELEHVSETSFLLINCFENGCKFHIQRCRESYAVNLFEVLISV